MEATLTTTVIASARDQAHFEELLARLRNAMLEVARDYPAISAVLVEPADGEYEFRVGLKFRGINPKYAEDTADEVLTAAIEHASTNVDHFDVEQAELALV